jgi:hypothetical protein
LRRLHNLALDLGWLPWPILAKRAWPKIRSQSKRAITAEEHAAVIASEKNTERRAYYELLYETGAAPKPMQQISQQKTLIGKTAFLFIAAKNSDRSASHVD